VGLTENRYTPKLLPSNNREHDYKTHVYGEKYDNCTSKHGGFICFMEIQGV
jgi:hypothetical protein